MKKIGLIMTILAFTLFLTQRCKKEKKECFEKTHDVLVNFKLGFKPSGGDSVFLNRFLSALKDLPAELILSKTHQDKVYYLALKTEDVKRGLRMETKAISDTQFIGSRKPVGPDQLGIFADRFRGLADSMFVSNELITDGCDVKSGSITVEGPKKGGGLSPILTYLLKRK